MERGSGILLHITSLPAAYGLGDFGSGAYHFADYLALAGQKYWQILPLNPTSTGDFHSPYSSNSAFALNPLFISIEELADRQLVNPANIPPPIKPQETGVDYQSAWDLKKNLINEAMTNFSRQPTEDFNHFCQNHSWWLDDFCLFTIIKSNICSRPWNQWPPELKNRNPGSLNQIQKQYGSQIQKEKFIQYSLYRQWTNLKNYCNHKNIKIIGDMPIYPSMDSAEVWANPHIFKLDDEGQPLVVSGVPPDYFSSQGQLWGNPVYDWDRLKADQYSWWSNRLAHNFSLFDLTRIDHFRGLVAYWEIPATEKNAINGNWAKVPVYDFFDHLESQYNQLPIIAEDLGYITDDVREVLNHYRFPTMKVLLFAFGQDDHAYMPHNYDRNCFSYTGTHDNNTAIGWYLNEATAQQKERLDQYTGKHIDKDNVHAELMRLAMQSVAEASIIPMQDVLGLDSSARMNLPATVGHNWKWALCPQYRLDRKSAQRLADFTRIYGRL